MALLGAASAIRFSPTDPEYYAATEAEVNLSSSILRRHRKPKAHKDAYDLDPDTVSQYDDMKQYFINPADKAAHIKKRETYGAQRIHGDTRAQIASSHRLHHHHRHNKHHGKKDAYDHDPHTTSEFDDASNINGGNPYMKAIAGDDSSSGPNLKLLESKIADKLKAKEAAKGKVEGPDVPEVRAGADAREGFAGAIARDRHGNPQYDMHGASPQQIQQQEEAEAAAAAAAAKEDAEAEKAADEAVADEEKKAEAKEADAKATEAAKAADPTEENKKADAEAAKPENVAAKAAKEAAEKEAEKPAAF